MTTVLPVPATVAPFSCRNCRGTRYEVVKPEYSDLPSGEVTDLVRCAGCQTAHIRRRYPDTPAEQPPPPPAAAPPIEDATSAAPKAKGQSRDVGRTRRRN